MIKQSRQYSNLKNEKINLINKIRKMENVIWDDMLEDTQLGKDVVDIDFLIDRFESTKNLYKTHLLIKQLKDYLNEEK